MDYLDNLTLTILISLLRNRELTISSPDEETLEDLACFISTLDGLFINRPENMSLEQEEEFSENYVKTIKYEVRLNTVNISCDNIERIDAFLREYIENYKNGTLLENGDVNRFDTISALHDMLIAKTVGKTTNNVRYIETDIKYAPLILLKYFENNDFIQGLTIQLAPVEEIQYPMILFERSWDGTPEEYTSNWQDYFRCRYVLNLEWYLEENNRSISKTITKERRENFEPKIARIYKYLLKCAQDKAFSISKYDLKNYTTLKTKDKTLSDLRAQYREIFRKVPEFNIISYDKKNDLYIINNDILTDKRN